MEININTNEYDFFTKATIDEFSDFINSNIVKIPKFEFNFNDFYMFIYIYKSAIKKFFRPSFKAINKEAKLLIKLQKKETSQYRDIYKNTFSMLKVLSIFNYFKQSILNVDVQFREIFEEERAKKLKIFYLNLLNFTKFNNIEKIKIQKNHPNFNKDQVKNKIRNKTNNLFFTIRDKQKYIFKKGKEKLKQKIEEAKKERENLAKQRLENEGSMLEFKYLLEEQSKNIEQKNEEEVNKI